MHSRSQVFSGRQRPGLRHAANQSYDRFYLKAAAAINAFERKRAILIAYFLNKEVTRIMNRKRKRNPNSEHSRRAVQP